MANLHPQLASQNQQLAAFPPTCQQKSAMPMAVPPTLVADMIGEQ